jgi:hypothetical protein
LPLFKLLLHSLPLLPFQVSHFLDTKRVLAGRLPLLFFSFSWLCHLTIVSLVRKRVLRELYVREGRRRMVKRKKVLMMYWDIALRGSEVG